MAYFSSEEMTNIKTIDDLISHTLAYYIILAKNTKYEDAEFTDEYLIIRSESSQILDVLLSSTNVPSKYDLSIIKVHQIRLNNQLHERINKVSRDILEVYKNRNIQPLVTP